MRILCGWAGVVAALSWGVAGAQGVVAKQGTVRTPDVDLATWTYGAGAKGTPVIAVNGGPGLSHVYLVQNDVWTARIARVRPVVLYDQRGTGLSGGVSGRMTAGAAQTMDAQVADLEAVRASLGVDRVDLLGDSYGGLLVSAYGAAHPEHVRRMILSDSAAPGFAKLHPRLGEFFPDVEAESAERVKGLDAAKAADVELRDHFRMIFYSQEKLAQYLAGAPDLGNSPAAGEAVGTAIAKLDLTDAMARFRFPVLVLEGRYDANVTPDVSWAVAHNIPGARLVMFERSGHLPYYEEPEKYAEVVSAFLAEGDGR